MLLFYFHRQSHSTHERWSVECRTHKTLTRSFLTRESERNFPCRGKLQALGNKISLALFVHNNSQIFISSMTKRKMKHKFSPYINTFLERSHCLLLVHHLASRSSYSRVLYRCSKFFILTYFNRWKLAKKARRWRRKFRLPFNVVWSTRIKNVECGMMCFIKTS